MVMVASTPSGRGRHGGVSRLIFQYWKPRMFVTFNVGWVFFKVDVTTHVGACCRVLFSVEWKFLPKRGGVVLHNSATCEEITCDASGSGDAVRLLLERGCKPVWRKVSAPCKDCYSKTHGDMFDGIISMEKMNAMQHGGADSVLR